MKYFGIILFTLFIASSLIYAQDVTTVKAISSEISDNLDLKAVASVFGESSDLEDFERRLNDPETRISNLDLNQDGMVDYLRVIELSDAETHLVVIQAATGKDQFQDVATIDVEKNDRDLVRVQIVGSVFIYGSNYIIEPFYYYRPGIVFYLWSDLYVPWYSPYYWDFYPAFYSPWPVYLTYIYVKYIYQYTDPGIKYQFTNQRHSITAAKLHETVVRNDIAKIHPEQSFLTRHKSIKNKAELDQQRNKEKTSPIFSDPQKQKGSNGKDNWKQVPEEQDKSIKGQSKKSVEPNVPAKVKESPNISDRSKTKKTKSKSNSR